MSSSLRPVEVSSIFSLKRTPVSLGIVSKHLEARLTLATLYITICYSASHSYKRTLRDLFKLAAK